MAILGMTLQKQERWGHFRVPHGLGPWWTYGLTDVAHPKLSESSAVICGVALLSDMLDEGIPATVESSRALRLRSTARITPVILVVRNTRGGRKAATIVDG